VVIEDKSFWVVWRVSTGRCAESAESANRRRRAPGPEAGDAARRRRAESVENTERQNFSGRPPV